MSSIKINYQQHEQLVEYIKNNYPPSVYAMRWKMKLQLGFTIRYIDRHNRKADVWLDFVDDSKKVWFLLKWEGLFE